MSSVNVGLIKLTFCQDVVHTSQLKFQFQVRSQVTGYDNYTLDDFAKTNV